jgi:hypothetical protein
MLDADLLLAAMHTRRETWRIEALTAATLKQKLQKSESKLAACRCESWKQDLKSCQGRLDACVQQVKTAISVLGNDGALYKCLMCNQAWALSKQQSTTVACPKCGPVRTNGLGRCISVLNLATLVGILKGLITP